jgi:prepilin-type N-terminal cleavage/methylation domain-containing protein
MKNILSDNRGFTIVEVIASVFIFSVIVSFVGAIFVQSLRIERRSFSVQKIQENSLRSFEIMAREVRVSSVVEGDHTCSEGISTITFDRPGVGTIIYSLSDGQIYRQEASGEPEPITSSDVTYNSLVFCILGSTATDYMPTRITILAQVENTAGTEKNVINIQTTVTSRDISNDLQY